MCIYCGVMKQIESHTVFAIDYKGKTIVVRNVPCLECPHCGEEEFTDEVARRLNKIVEEGKKSISEIFVADFESFREVAA